MLKLAVCHSYWPAGSPSGNHQPREALTTRGWTMSVTRAFWVMAPYFVSITTTSPSRMSTGPPCRDGLHRRMGTLLSRSRLTHR